MIKISTETVFSSRPRLIFLFVVSNSTEICMSLRALELMNSSVLPCGGKYVPAPMVGTVFFPRTVS